MKESISKRLDNVVNSGKIVVNKKQQTVEPCGCRDKNKGFKKFFDERIA